MGGLLWSVIRRRFEIRDWRGCRRKRKFGWIRKSKNKSMKWKEKDGKGSGTYSGDKIKGGGKEGGRRE